MASTHPKETEELGGQESMLPIDMKKGIELIGGDEGMFWDVMGKFEELTFDNSMQKMYESFKARDYAQLKASAHTLKGASGYIEDTEANDTLKLPWGYTIL
eukprot:TRINITY_DN10681_c0_g1_i1.p1 TRINITY_DN10681_c0_g1~~TRINITY_DN10681_c0_g1_i1.p1  ORF type:complete len:101 (+),score=12.33 TRINITY_DN10681_c0_g1_i1:116-418(+)